MTEKKCVQNKLNVILLLMQNNIRLKKRKGYLSILDIGTFFLQLVWLLGALFPINSYWSFTVEKTEGGKLGRGILTKHFPLRISLGS